MKWLKRSSVVLAVLVVIVVVLPWVLGWLMPREHHASGSALVPAPIDQVWRSVSGFDELGQWAPDIVNMQRVSDVRGLPSYEMRGDRYVVTFTFKEVSKPHSLVVALADDQRNYGGTWHYQLVAEPAGTRVTITERGWTEPPNFRFMIWLLGHDRTIHSFLEALKRKHSAANNPL